MYNKDFEEYIVSQSTPTVKPKSASHAKSRILCWLFRFFSERNTFVKVSFLLCTILFDLASILTYIEGNTAVHPVVIIFLLIANIVSTLGAILTLCFSKVPDLYGYEYHEAVKILQREGFYKYSINCDDVIVMDQKPRAGEVVSKGTKITLTVGKSSSDGSLKKMDAAFDEIPEKLIQQFRVALAMAGQLNSSNKRMIITEEDGTGSTVEVVFTFKFADSEQEFVVYCEGLYEDNTPKLCVSRIKNGVLVDFDDEHWKRIRTLMRYVGYSKEPLGAKRTGKDGIEILC